MSLGLAQNERNDLPDGWVLARIGDICEVNPRHERGVSTDDTPVSFVPMAAVDQETGAIFGSSARPYGQVRKGFTHFAEGDILFARITPCMENGKVAVARGLVNDLGCGTTEFHVLRPLGGILSEYIHRYLRQESFRRAAAANMSGTAGQLRVSTDYMKSVELPLPPLSEQRRIVAKIEALFEQSRTARQALDRIPPLLKKFRQSVLAAAFRGDLTRDWREQTPDIEPASALLERIRAARRRKRDEDLRAKGKDPRKARYEEPGPVDTSDLPEIPRGWVWTNVNTLISDARYGTSQKCVKKPHGVAVLRIPNVVRGRIDLTDLKFGDINHRELRKLLVRPGDLLVVRTNGSLDLVGKAALVPELPKPCAFASYLIRVRPVLNSTLARYIDLVFCSDLARTPIEVKARSTAGQFNVNLETLRSIRLPLPPIDEMQELVEMVVSLSGQADAIEVAVEAARRRADKLEQSILARAFRGELVLQDPSDEPASALLERIRAERPRSNTTQKSLASSPRQKKRQGRKGMANM